MRNWKPEAIRALHIQEEIDQIIAAMLLIARGPVQREEAQS